jgi:hypothetical protein
VWDAALVCDGIAEESGNLALFGFGLRIGGREHGARRLSGANGRTALTSQADRDQGSSDQIGINLHGNEHYEVLLYLNFRRLAETLIVMALLPFALVGGLWLLWLMGFNLSVAVFIAGLLPILWSTGTEVMQRGDCAPSCG